MKHDRQEALETSCGHVVFIDHGRLSAAAIVVLSEKKCRVADTQGNKRRIGNDKIVAYTGDQDEADELIAGASELAGRVDMEKAWQVSGGKKISVAELAARLLPDAAERQRVAAVMLAHSRLRAFFNEDKDGAWQPVSAARHDKIRESFARRKEHQEREASWAAELDQGTIPEPIKGCLQERFGHGFNPDDRTFRFLLGYCRRTGKSIGELALSCGIFKDMEELHLRECLRDYPQERNEDTSQVPNLEGLPVVAKGGLSIDSRGTVEIDDAFATVKKDGGTCQVAICIASPAMGMGGQSELQARERMVTLYLPGRKEMMLPQPAIDSYSLVAPGNRPTVALLCDFSEGGKVTQVGFVAGAVDMKANIAIEDFGPESLETAGMDQGAKETMHVLKDFAAALKPSGARAGHDRGFIVGLSNGKPYVLPRAGFAAVDDLVAGMMVHYNTAAAKHLKDKGVVFLGRKGGLLTAIDKDTDAGSAYGWFTSPLRRLIDLVNQRQLLAVINGQVPPYQTGELRDIARSFDGKYEWAKTRQREMDRFWCLRIVQERSGEALQATATNAKGKFRLDDYPLTVNVEGSGVKQNEKAMVIIEKVDTYKLTAEGRLA